MAGLAYAINVGTHDTTEKDKWIEAEQEWLTQWLEAKKLREKADRLKAIWVESETKKIKDLNDA